MRQLALDIRPADHAVFESFHAGPNALAVTSVRDVAAGRGGPLAWIWGAPETGRSHLLQAAVARAHESGAQTAYLPLGELRSLSAEVLEGTAARDLVAIDDVNEVTGDGAWERALFRLHEQLLGAGGRLLLAAHRPPQAAGFALADLASRFAAGVVFRLEALTDEDRVLALQRRAAWRGLDLPEETARFLLARVTRSAGSLFRLLDELDRAALAAQRRLTIPFVRSVLEAAG
jgi:DnaA family protein